MLVGFLFLKKPNLLQFHLGDVGLISAQLHPILIEILK
jgi:hypothetical protein